MTTLSVPLDAVKNCTGFSVDFGSSVLKTVVVVKLKENGQVWAPTDGSNSAKSAHLLFQSFPRVNTEPTSPCMEAKQHMVNFIKKNVDLGKMGDKALVHTCGVGLAHIKNEVEEDLNISLVNGSEAAYPVKALYVLLKHLPLEDLCWSIPSEECTLVLKEAKKLYNASQLWSEKPTGSLAHGYCSQFPGQTGLPDVSSPGEENKEKMFPCIFITGGSTAQGALVMEDGSYVFGTFSMSSGLSVLGLASLILGINSYSELLALAENGDENNVTTFMKDVIPKDTNDALYDALAKEMPVFAFGKAHGSTIGDFNREDLARAILHHVVLGVVDMGRQFANTHGVRRVFYSGGLFNSQMTRDMAYRHHHFMQYTQLDMCHSIEAHFPKMGDFYGAIGAIFANSEALSS